MTANPDDAQGGFDTSSELRRGEVLPNAPDPNAPLPNEQTGQAGPYSRYPVPRHDQSEAWRSWLIAVVVVVVVGIAIYFLVTSL